MSTVVFFQVIKAFVLPIIKAEAERVQFAAEGPMLNNIDRIAADHIKQALVVVFFGSNLIYNSRCN